ncbi:MAG TPA: RDD family protein [Candidatus Limnocylindrales bacterium]
MRSAESALPVGYIEPTFGQRLAGRFIDGLAIGLVGFALDELVGIGVFVVVWLAYEIGFTLAWRGLTPGKRLTGMRVVSVVGGPPSPGRLVLRAVVLGLMLFTPLAVLLLVLVLKGPLHRGCTTWSPAPS